MKITWFGGRTLRIHIGGSILVTDPPDDAGEIVSGADLLFRLDDPSMRVVESWRPRREVRLVDEPDSTSVDLVRIGGAVLVDAMGEPPLLLGPPPPAPGRWASDAVVVLFAPTTPPPVRLIVLALDDVDAAIARIAPALEDTGLVALERGMALEV